MHLTSAAKVGFVISLAIAAFLFVYFGVLRVGSLSQGYTVYATFRDTQNLEVGADVRMAGVPIGQVQEVTLTPDNRARVGMRIGQSHRIPQGSRFLITAGGLIGQQYVSIIPRSGRGPALRDNAVVEGTDRPAFDELLTQASDLTETTNRIGRRIETLTVNLNRLLLDRDLNRNLRDAVANMAEATDRATRLMDELRATTASASPQLRRMLASASETAGRFGETAEALNELLTGTGDQLRGDMGELVRTFKRTADRLDATVANLQTLTSDPKWSQDLTELVDNLKAGSQNAREALANLRDAARTTGEAAASFKDTADIVNNRVARLLGRPRPPSATTDGQPTTPASPPPVPTATHLDVYQIFRPGQLRVDANQTIALGRDRFAYLGLRDIGEATRVNLQLGRSLNERLALRAGLYDSRLGLGIDYNLGGGSGLTANLYRPDEPNLDVYARKRINDRFTGLLGIENAFGRNRAVLGLRYQP